MKSIKIAIVVSALVISSCGGKETIVREVLVTTAPVPTTIEEVKPATSFNKYSRYLDELRGRSGQANSWTDDNLIELAHLVCEAFDGGSSLLEVIEVFSNNSSGSYDDELFAAVIYGSVTHVCPKHKAMVDAQL